jgi:hypothetical protein
MHFGGNLAQLHVASAVIALQPSPTMNPAALMASRNCCFKKRGPQKLHALLAVRAAALPMSRENVHDIAVLNDVRFSL